MSPSTKQCPRCGQQTALWVTTCALCGLVYRNHTTPPAAPAPTAVRDMARLKSYTGACVIVILLYCFLFVPGLVANWLYLEDARRMEDIAGEPLPGVSTLHTMQTVVFWGAGLFLAIIVLAMIAG